MLYPPGFYYVKKTKRFVISSSDKSSERNLSCFFDVIKPRRMKHLQNQEPVSSDPYFSTFHDRISWAYGSNLLSGRLNVTESQKQMKALAIFTENKPNTLRITSWMRLVCFMEESTTSAFKIYSPLVPTPYCTKNCLLY